MKAKVLVAAAVVLSATGCGSTGWKSEYACPGMPNGVICKSPTEVYKMTENTDRISGEPSGSAGAQASSKEAAGQRSERGNRLIPGQISTGRNAPREALPILEPAKVMRVWIAPWIDAKQDLHMPGYVFTEVTPRRWSFGEAAAITGKPLVPLQMDMRGPVAEEGEPEVGNEAKMLMPRGLVQGMQQQGGAPNAAGAAASSLVPSAGAR
ncbi:type IV conjugative transfer system lipoprotein TraV [Noviherbaspirillum sp. CPCC 100848]|uniref:Type IV conjugative transfer system lipoprotein TraV n=1 Tax=Noviherbaspirillum album TaxID=3080276 RepID=A0ABU6J3K7_9BURK|nr:type IV conjugative transfer system lipoprotein TraV [Noviherbaspirillum sp. CPCC 100848]MEC4718202.1 type IV conjugative transfer system lipoprotein TraV [Noviherbaspirillum sp. CPCC 100848]